MAKQQEDEIPCGELLAALQHCQSVGTQTLKTLRSSCIAVRVARNVFGSERLGVIREDDEKTYVIFRGSESSLAGWGTWLITNLQAASTSFGAVDASLVHRGGENAPERRVQGSTYRIIAPGVVHQGFIRTWSQLWYGSDIPSLTFLQPVSVRHLLTRYLVIAVVAAIIGTIIGLWFSLALSTIIIVAICTVLLLAALESGAIERLFWRDTSAVTDSGRQNDGEPLRNILSKKCPTKAIWFVGHSLGGALATLAFAAHLNKYESVNQAPNVRLVTFASPLIGDCTFVKYFTETYRGQFIHVVSDADPVPLSPPPVPSQLWKTVRSKLGIAALALMVISLFWKWVYTRLWKGQKQYAPWYEDDLIRLETRQRSLCVSQHPMDRYEALLTNKNARP